MESQHFEGTCMCVCFLVSNHGSILSYYLCRTQHKKSYDISGSNSNGQPSGDIDLQEQHSGNGNAVKEGTATASNGASQNGHSTASENGRSTASENGHSTAQEMTQPGTFKVCGFWIWEELESNNIGFRSTLLCPNWGRLMIHQLDRKCTITISGISWSWLYSTAYQLINSWPLIRR